jgi:hypothetical protein
VSLTSIRLAVLGAAFAAAAVAQVAILQIQVVEGEGTVHVPGVRSGHRLTVSIADESGRPVAGATVSFHLPESGAGGAFVNGLRTDIAITDARGRATVRAFQANRTPGRFQIRIVASKEQARAGTVSFQYIGELKPGTAASPGSHRKWIAIAAAVGGGAAAGILASRGSASAPAAAPPPTAPPVLTVGIPVISVGKP